MTVTPSSTISMPSENSFKQHAELARNALKTFNAVRQLDSSALPVIKTALNELVNVTVDFTRFIPFFLSHPLFQEIPSLVHSTLEEFFSQHPNFERPSAYPRIVGLHARVQDSIQISAKRGTYPTFLLLSHLIFLAALAAISAANLRPEKGKKTKTSVSFFSSSFIFRLLNLL